jgi:hypothetical protein
MVTTTKWMATVIIHDDGGNRLAKFHIYTFGSEMQPKKFALLPSYSRAAKENNRPIWSPCFLTTIVVYKVHNVPYLIFVTFTYVTPIHTRNNNAN